MKKYIVIALAALFCTSCEKEIEIDYRSIEPLYVIEGLLSGSMCEVSITKTRDMQDGSAPQFVSGANVKITAIGRAEAVLEQGADGLYRDQLFVGLEGEEYTLDVTIDGETYSSTSMMKSAPESVHQKYEWQYIMDNKILYTSVKLMDKAGEENYYYYEITVDGAPHRWGIAKDDNRDGEELNIPITLNDIYSEAEGEYEDDDVVVREGSDLLVEVRSIDRRSYDYLQSVSLSDNSGSNPIPNFSGDVMGYFSAYSCVEVRTENFSYSAVEGVK